MLAVQLDADETTARASGGDEGRSRSAKGVQHYAVPLAERANERFQRLDRLLRRMKPVSRVGKIHNIRERIGGRSGVAFGEKIGLLVLITHEADGRGVCLAEDDIPDVGVATPYEIVPRALGTIPLLCTVTQPFMARRATPI